MCRSKRIAACFLLSLMVCGLGFLAEAASWEQMRGPGASMYAGDLPDREYGLSESWKVELGSGYSNVWVDGGKAVTMFTSGDVDVVAAFESKTGKELWRFELGEKYAGHDGSDDGPLSTPTVSDGVVYALGPKGQLVALNLANGKMKWQRMLDEETSTVPPYGYTSSPVVTGKHVIIATGGEGHAVTAFDHATGEPKWTSGDDGVTYQTPMMMRLVGRDQLIAVTDQFVQGIDPSNGKILWQKQHTEEEGRTENSAHPTAVDDRRFLVKYGRGSRLYSYNGEDVEEVWQSRAFGNSLALPVLVGDHFYGFTGAVLTCASVETGEILWRSRDLASFGLSAVDGLLAVVSRDGDLVLVDPSPEGYKERTRVSVFDEGDYAIPSYNNGHFVVRNLAQMASLRVDGSLKSEAAIVDVSDRLLGEFGEWIASIEALPESERQSAVDQRVDGSGPIFGKDGEVHLTWRGAVEDVAVRGVINASGQDEGMYRVDGTDLFFRGYALDPKAQYTYNLIVDYGDAVRDAGNPYFVDNGFNQSSELRMPDWPASPHLEEPDADAPRGRLDGFPFRSEILENSREIQVWRPADYGQDAERRYPVLVVNHGDNLIRGGLMQNTLDNLVGKSVEPLIAVFVPRAGAPEYGGEAAENYSRFLVEELLPHVERHYPIDPTRRAIMGPASAGVAAIYAAFQYPDVFKKAAVQSYYPIQPAEEQLPEMIAKAGPHPDLIYVAWSRHDYDFGPGRQTEPATRELLGHLRERGVAVTEQVADYSPGWSGWRGQHDEILTALFPAIAKE